MSLLQDFVDQHEEAYGPGFHMVVSRENLITEYDDPSLDVTPTYSTVRRWFTDHESSFRYYRCGTVMILWFLEGEQDIATLFKLTWA